MCTEVVGIVLQGVIFTRKIAKRRLSMAWDLQILRGFSFVSLAIETPPFYGRFIKHRVSDEVDEDCEASRVNEQLRHLLVFFNFN